LAPIGFISSPEMTSKKPGITISNLEVSHISKHGLWLVHDAQEYLLPYDQFPWFQEAPVKHVFNVEEPHSGHLYWPDLDVDLWECSANRV
jgi:hypothetical protein